MEMFNDRSYDTLVRVEIKSTSNEDVKKYLFYILKHYFINPSNNTLNISIFIFTYNTIK